MIKAWRIVLHDYLQSIKTKQFQWGEHDCCLFAANCVREITGKDPARKYRGKYNSQRSAYRVLKDLDGGDVEAAFNVVFGPLKPRLNATDGDLALIETNLGKTVCVVFGGTVWAVSFDGLITLPFKRVIGIWPVANYARAK